MKELRMALLRHNCSFLISFGIMKWSIFLSKNSIASHYALKSDQSAFESLCVDVSACWTYQIFLDGHQFDFALARHQVCLVETLSMAGYRMQTLKNMIKKCMVVCRVVTYVRRSFLHPADPQEKSCGLYSQRKPDCRCESWCLSQFVLLHVSISPGLVF